MSKIHIPKIILVLSCINTCACHCTCIVVRSQTWVLVLALYLVWDRVSVNSRLADPWASHLTIGVLTWHAPPYPLFFTWFQGCKLKSSDCVPSTFIHWAVSLVQVVCICFSKGGILPLFNLAIFIFLTLKITFKLWILISIQYMKMKVPSSSVTLAGHIDKLI